MAQPVIKTSFAGGEWAPKLRGRVDLQKYHAGAALMRNFFVDFVGGGASTRPGTTYVLQTKTFGARIFSFQPSSALGYVLEFGDHYIRFFFGGSPVLESSFAITAITNANPGVVTAAGHNFVVGDWVFITGVQGMGQVNGRYFPVIAASGSTFTLGNLIPFFTNTDTTGYGVYTSGGVAARVYTLPTPYSVNDLFYNPTTANPGLKFVQNVTSLIITHPNYPPQVLTELTAANWTLTAITYTPTIGTPTGLALTSNLGAGTFQYGYIVTAVDANGQESLPSAVVTLGSLLSIINSPGTNSLSWAAVPGAASYNVYRTSPTVTVSIVSGAQYGFVGNVTGTQFTETTPGIAPDFSQGPPLGPSQGSAVKHVNINVNGAYTAVPAVSIAAPPSGLTAAANASMAISSAAPSAFVVNSFLAGTTTPASPVGATLTIPATGGGTVRIASATQVGITTQWTVNTLTVPNGGSITGAGTSLPASYTPPGGGATLLTPPSGLTVSVNSGGVTLTWQIGSFVVTQHGSGYLTAPAVTVTPGPGTATAVIGPTVGGISINPTASGNPGVCGFFQERLVLAAPPGAIQTYYMSEPGLFYNFSTSFPSQDSDAIQGTIISEDLNDIRTMINVPTGLIFFTGKGAWLINGGGGVSVNNPITPANQSASPQAFSGSNDLRPIKVNYDIIYSTNKGNYVRDLSYNIYASVYTGSDISLFSNHFFYNHVIVDWDFSEEPYKILWGVRDDGILLSLTYIKEQELMGWAQHDSDGQFTSVCTVIETPQVVQSNIGLATELTANIVDATYFIVQRYIQGSFIQFIERLADRFFTYGQEDAICVDAAVITGNISVQGVLTPLGNASAIGNTVVLQDTVALPFTSTMGSNSWIVRAGGGIYRMTSFIDTGHVNAVVVQVPSQIDPYTGQAYLINEIYSIWQPFTQFGGLWHLIGKTVTGLADGVVITPQVVPANATINLPGPSTKISVGLAYTPQLQTLPLDTGEPTIQSKRKKLNAVTLRVADTLGLQVGTTFANVVTMKDFQLGSIPTVSNGPSSVTGLVSGDGRTIMDQVWQEPGQLCIQQNLPYPATVIAVMPEVTVGDTKSKSQL